jgi:hypothetical protein
MEKFGKMDTKQLVSIVQQHICTLVIDGQKVPCQAQFESFGVSAYSLYFSPPDLI